MRLQGARALQNRGQTGRRGGPDGGVARLGAASRARVVRGWARARKVATFPGQGAALLKTMYDTHTRLASQFAARIGLDETAVLWDVISISAGVRGTQIIIGPDDYVRATKATGF